MLDTIALTLNHTEFEIINADAFSPSARGLLKAPYYTLGARANFSCKQNHTKEELSKGLYKPRLTLTRRKGPSGFFLTLRVEFSAPKLIFGNNFDELSESHFERIVDILHDKLAGMGVQTRKETLRNASISAIHYSKNIPLTDYSTCSMILGELAKVEPMTRLDLNKTDYRNGGHAVRYHANSYEIVFYDKQKDMEKAVISRKRAVEDDNVLNYDLFKNQDYPKHFQVLRMEVRLGNRTKIKGLLSQIGITRPLTFRELFSGTISQKVQLHFWQKITQDMPLLALSQFKPEDIAQAMIIESKGKIKPGKLLQHLGLLTLVRSVGFLGARALLERQCNPRTLQWLKKEMNELALLDHTKYVAITNVRSCLGAFKPVRMRDYMLAKNQGSGSASIKQKSRRQASRAKAKNISLRKGAGR